MDFMSLLGHFLANGGGGGGGFNFRDSDDSSDDDYEEDENEYPPPYLDGKFRLKDSFSRSYLEGVSLVDDYINDFQKLIKKDDIDAVKAYLEGKEYKPGIIDIYYPFSDNFDVQSHMAEDRELSDLDIACFYGSAKCFKYLFPLGDFDLTECPLYAVFGQNIEIIQMLIDQEVEFYDVSDAINALVQCGRKISPEIMRLLIEKANVKLDISDVIHIGDPELVEMALKQNSKVDAKCIPYAAKAGLRDLLMKIVTPENVDQEIEKKYEYIMKWPTIVGGGETALFFAAENKDFEMYKFLIEKGASPLHYLETNGLTPLTYAFNDVDFGMQVLQLTPLDNDIYEHLVTDALIYNAVEMLRRLLEHPFKPSRKIRGAACLARSKEVAELINAHQNVFEVAEADIALINAKSRSTRSEVAGLFKANGGPSKEYLDKGRFGKSKNEAQDRNLMFAMMSGNEDTVAAIAKKRGGLKLSNGRNVFNSPMFNFSHLSMYLAFEAKTDLNPRNQMTPLLAAAYPVIRVNMHNIALMLYSRGADPTIEFEGVNVLGSLYRSICRYVSNNDFQKFLWLTRQRIYEITGRAKERELEKADEEVYDDYF